MVAETGSLITVREAARECGRTAETIRRWIWSGKLTAQKVGNQLFIRRTDLARCGCGGYLDVADQLAALQNIKAVRERIRQRLGDNIDVLEALDHSRESHP